MLASGERVKSAYGPKAVRPSAGHLLVKLTIPNVRPLYLVCALCISAGHNTLLDKPKRGHFLGQSASRLGPAPWAVEWLGHSGPLRNVCASLRPWPARLVLMSYCPIVLTNS